MKLLPILALLLLSGCTSVDQLNLPEPSQVRILGSPFVQSSKYAVILKGETFDLPKQSSFITDADDLTLGQRQVDPYLDNDVDQLSRLALSKGYVVYIADMGFNSPKEVFNLLDSIAIASNQETKIFFAYTGEGDKRGLVTRRCLANGFSLTFETCRISPEALIGSINKISGKKAVLINACESGCFVECARSNLEFRGVIIASCAVGYSTTPHEPSNLSATYAAFLGQYQDDPKTVKNLATLDLKKAGFWWNNLRHQISDLGGVGLPISYDLVKFSNTDYLF